MAVRLERIKVGKMQHPIPKEDKSLANIKLFGPGVRLFGPSDRSVFDPYSLVHFSYGYIAARYGLTFQQTVLLSVIYELIEDHIVERMQRAQQDVWEKEDKYNALADVLMAILGYSLYDYNKSSR